MKTIIAIAMFLIVAQLSYAQKATIEDHPNYSEISKQLETLITETSKKQSTYFDTYHKYFQGLVIPTAQCDGVTSKTAEVTKKPSDQAVSWDQFNSAIYKSDTAFLFNSKIDVYKSPAGSGWMLTAQLKYNDLYWIYSHHEGPEASGTKLDEWRSYTQEDMVSK